MAHPSTHYCNCSVLTSSIHGIKWRYLIFLPVVVYFLPLCWKIFSKLKWLCCRQTQYTVYASKSAWLVGWLHLVFYWNLQFANLADITNSPCHRSSQITHACLIDFDKWMDHFACDATWWKKCSEILKRSRVSLIISQSVLINKL